MLPFRKFSANVTDRLGALRLVARRSGRFHVAQHLRAANWLSREALIFESHVMINEAMKIRQMLRAARRQLRSDLSALAKEVLQHRYGARREVSQKSTEVRDLDVQHLTIELALRTMASRYALLSRIDEALERPDEVACLSPECVAAKSAASHDAVPV